jgi:hypothetical protein
VDGGQCTFRCSTKPAAQTVLCCPTMEWRKSILLVIFLLVHRAVTRQNINCIMVSGELLLLLLHGLGPLIQQGGGLLAHGRCDGRLLALLGEASATATSPPWTASMG